MVAKQVHAGTPVLSAAPISPEEGCRTNGERMQQDADLAWLFGGAALPLTLLAQRTGTATANAGSIHDAQAPIGFSALFVRSELLVCRAPKRSIGLESKVLTCEATGLPSTPTSGGA